MLKNANELNFLYVNVCNYSYLCLTLSSELIKINVKRTEFPWVYYAIGVLTKIINIKKYSMKKLLFFTMSAMLLAACSSEELSVQESPSEASGNAVVKFDAYALRGLTRAGAAGDVTNGNIGTKGFGVFAYYTDGAKYSKTATPDFMYNQKVVKTGDAWTYEPAKYWPNEFGETAKSEGTDYVTFFAYAPWTEFVPTTGKPVTTNARDERYNIIGIKDNSTAGDPIVQYVVDTDPATSVDLLWGVAKEDPASYYTPIAGTSTVTTGLPFLNMVKPSSATDGKLSFNLRHALAKVKVTIDFIADAATPTGTSATIESDETRIYVREASISGFALEGALNLNNVEANKPLWKDIDGEKSLIFADYVEFFDGRRDGYEGTTNGFNNGEINAMLNPEIIENYAATTETGVAPNTKIIFGADKKPGVTSTSQPLFASSADGFFYVIPRNGGQAVDLRLLYDVETIDARVAGLLADRVTHGKSIPNNITKEAIFGDNIDFEPGKQYVINIHLGMTSVKVDAEVTEWTETQPTVVIIPELSLQQALQSALAYTYSDRAYSGDWSVTNTTVTYTNTMAAATATESGRPTIINDIARMLGALYRAGGIRSISLGGKDFTWDPNGKLKGSNWVDSDGNTLISQLDDMFPTISGPVTVVTDKGSFTIEFVLS